MKQIILATLAFALSIGAAFAENPYVGMPEDQIAQDKAFRAPSHGPFFFSMQKGKVDYTAPASIHPTATLGSVAKLEENINYPDFSRLKMLSSR